MASWVIARTIVVHGAAGSVGGAVVQLAAAEGARVIAITSTRGDPGSARPATPEAGAAADVRVDVRVGLRVDVGAMAGSARPTRSCNRRPTGGAVELPAEGVDLDRLVADYERAWVARALEKAGGVRKKAAHLLGISFRSMRYRLAKLGFDKDATALDKDDDEPA